MKYLKISNGIEIEANAFKLLGACTKRGDTSKIGYFGSGLKYAMAVLMREGVEMRIFSGKKKVKIGTITENFRDTDFQIITINGEKTSLTTSMGVDWKLWQAIREIYCNALDEEDCQIMRGECEPIGEEGRTIFYIPMTGEVGELVAVWEQYFSQTREVLVECDLGKVFPIIDTTLTVYRSGIRCYDTTRKSLYDYDIPKIRINESRVIMYDWYLKDFIAGIWSKCATSEMIDNYVKLYRTVENPDLYMEYDNDWKDQRVKFSSVWLQYFKDKIIVPYTNAGGYRDYLQEPNSVVLPMNLIRALKDAFGDQIVCCSMGFRLGDNWSEAAPDNGREFVINKAKAFLNEAGYPIDYNIIVAVFDSKQVLGSIQKPDNIVLSTKLFDHGVRKVVATLIEESMHLATGFDDETRDFQNHMLNKIVCCLEDKTGNYL